MRLRLVAFAAVMFSGAAAFATPIAAANDAQDTLVFVGTYTGRESKGIYTFRLGPDDRPGPVGLAAATPSPAFLALDARRARLFAANENGSADGKLPGAVTAFAIDRSTGKLREVNQRSSMGAGPCHVALDREGRTLLVANYSGGTVATFRIEDDGRVGEPVSVIHHTGRSVNPARQEAPHPHSVTLDPANHYAFVCDLGIDKVMSYTFDAKTGALAPAPTPFVALRPGAGPRHMAFRPDARFAYVLNELDATVTVFAYDAAVGRLTSIETVSMLPPEFAGRRSGAEIAVAPDGRTLYASNRGHDSVAIFGIAADRGTLTRLSNLSTHGRTPRNFGISADGRVVAIGNQDSGSVLLCRVDQASGQLQPEGSPLSVPSPVSVVFFPLTEAR